MVMWTKNAFAAHILICCFCCFCLWFNLTVGKTDIAMSRNGAFPFHHHAHEIGPVVQWCFPWLFNKYKLLYSRRIKTWARHSIRFFFFFLLFCSVRCLTFSGFYFNKYDIRNDVTVALSGCTMHVASRVWVPVFVYENQHKNQHENAPNTKLLSIFSHVKMLWIQQNENKVRFLSFPLTWLHCSLLLSLTWIKALTTVM